MFTFESTMGAKLGKGVSKDVLDMANQCQNKKGYKNPVLTVDGILVEKGKLLLVRRGREPEKGKLALPGGIVEYGESTEDAVVRECKEETGVDTKPVRLLGVYSNPGRDPRGHFVTVAYVLDRIGGDLRAGDDAADAIFMSIRQLPTLAFDHGKIVKDFLGQK